MRMGCGTAGSVPCPVVYLHARPTSRQPPPCRRRCRRRAALHGSAGRRGQAGAAPAAHLWRHPALLDHLHAGKQGRGNVFSCAVCALGACKHGGKGSPPGTARGQYRLRAALCLLCRASPSRQSQYPNPASTSTPRCPQMGSFFVAQGVCMDRTISLPGGGTFVIPAASLR